MVDVGDGGRYGGMTAVEFVRGVLGESPYGKQVEIFGAVERGRRVSVVGCNGSGKDWASARVVLWWLHRYSPAKVVVTGPTQRQVNDIVWNEVRYAYGNAADRLEGRMFRSARYELDAQSFALGFSSDSPFNLQGFHSPNLLVVITEAHAVGRGDVDALRRLNPRLLLMTGNPFTVVGEFYDSHHSRRHQYETVQISVEDTPNVVEGRVVIPGMMTLEDVEDRKEDWGEGSAMYRSAVLGEFPDNLDTAVVPLRVAVDAGRRQVVGEGVVVVACDVARFGSDRTVIMRRQGGAASIVRRMRGNDTMQVAGALKSYCDENVVDVLVVDDAGVGGGVVDRLREMGLGGTRLVPFNGGHTALNSRRYFNRNAEVWWEMRRWYMDGLVSTDADDALIGQVSSREYYLHSNGTVRLEGKRDGSGGSPDEADALAMTFAVGSRGVGGFGLWV